VTDDEKGEVLRLLEAHERTLAVCRACAETTRDLAWEVKRGGTPAADALAATLEEAERVLGDVGQVEVVIARMKAALW
jgi:predicted metal-binding protein